MSDSPQSPSPNLKNVLHGCVLILGGSGTGKSHGVKQMISNLQDLSPKNIPHVYSINVRDKEYLTEFKQHTSISFEKITSIRDNSIVLVEDIITLTTKEEVQLRQLLNWQAHHKQLKVFCVSHNIFKTKLFNTISYFQYVVFTSALSNLAVMKNCLRYFQVEPEVWEELQSKIRLSEGKQGTYFFFDTNKRAFYVTQNLTDQSESRLLANAEKTTDTSQQKLEKSKQALQKRFELFFKGRDNSSQANAVFSILVNCLNPDHVRLVDLTLKFNSAKGIQRVSLVDYINSLLDSQARHEPDHSQMVVHNYIKSHCTIPKIFLLNKFFTSS